MPTDPQLSHGLFRSEDRSQPDTRSRRIRAFTLVEVMISMLVLSMVMLGFLGTFLQSRRTTESAVLHAAATSLIYGIIEQIKGLDYSTSLPSLVVDMSEPIIAPATTRTTPPLIRIRLNQGTMKWLQVRYTPAPADGSAPVPKAPTATPAPDALASTVGLSPGAIDNALGSLPLSTVTGTASQSINLTVWIWVDEIPLLAQDIKEVKQVTIVYTYTYLDGSKYRTVRDRAVFLRTRYDQ